MVPIAWQENYYDLVMLLVMVAKSQQSAPSRYFFAQLLPAISNLAYPKSTNIITPTPSV